MIDAPHGRAIAAGGVFYAVLALVGIVWMRLRGDPLPERLLAPAVPMGQAIAAGLVCGGALVAVAETVLARAAWAERLRGEVLELLEPLTARLAVGVAVVSGCAEEILFRGAVQPALGLVATAIVFGVLHGGLTREWRGWVAFATAAGLCLGVLADWSGGVLAPTAAHVTVNAVELVILSRRHARPR